MDRLRAFDWGGDPFEETGTGTHPFRTRLVNGRCYFLRENNLCRIQCELSYEMKPAGCRAFPLAVLEVGGQRFARLSYWCPSVIANTGKALAHQTRWINETAREVDRRTEPLRINESAEIGLEDFERLHGSLRRLLVAPLPVGQRLAAAATLIRRLDAAARGTSSLVVGEVIQVAEAAGATALATETRLAAHAAAGRRVLSWFLLQDRPPGRLSLVLRFLSIVLFNLRVGRLRCRAVDAKVSWGQMLRVRLEPSPEGVRLLTRYLEEKVESRRYVAGDTTLVAGFNVLVIAYAMANLVARAKAASAGRLSCSDDDVREGIAVADLLVVEHSAVYQGRVQQRLVQAALGHTDLCGDVMTLLDAAPSSDTANQHETR